MVIFSRSNSVCSSPGRSPTSSELEYWGVSRSDLEAPLYENQLGDPEYYGEHAQYLDDRPYERARSSYASSNTSTPLKEQSPFRDMGNPQASSQNQIYKSFGLFFHSKPNSHHRADPLSDHARLTSLSVTNPTKKTCSDLQHLQTRNDAENAMKQSVCWRMRLACLRRQLVCQRRQLACRKMQLACRQKQLAFWQRTPVPSSFIHTI